MGSPVFTRSRRQISGTGPAPSPHLIFSLLYLAWCVSYMDRAAMTFSAPALLHDIHLSPTEQGFILGIFYLSYSCMQVPGGWLADRFGAKPVVVAGLVAWSSFTLGTGLATSVFGLLAIRFFFGLGEGVFPAASLKALHDAVPVASRDKAPAALMSSNYFGYLIAPSLLLPILACMGWRWTFYVMSGAGLLCAVLYQFLVPGQAPPSRTTAKGSSLIRALQLPGIPRLMITWFLISFINKALESWMPTYLLHERGVSIKAAGILLTLPYAAAMVASIAGGWIMARWFRTKEEVFISISVAFSCMSLLAMACSASVISVVGFETTLYFFKTLVFAAVLCLPARSLPPEIVGSGYGLINFGGQFAGFVAPPVIGWLLQAFGSYPIAFFSLLVAGILALALNLILGRFPAYGPDLRPSFPE